MKFLHVKKFLHFEFLPFWVVYAPVFPYYLWLSFKARSITFFSAANPSFPLGGFFGESKMDILNKIELAYKPKTIFFAKNTSTKDALNAIANLEINYPFICKPDVGERGKGVELVTSLEHFESYILSAHQDFIIQEYIDFPLELGVFYARIPNEENGRILSIIEKNFLHVVGNGIEPTRTLLSKTIRGSFVLQNLEKLYPEKMSYVPKTGEKLMVEPIGNHSRGTEFLNACGRINPQIEHVFNRISKPIEGFFFGRFDLRVASWQDLEQGKNIKIVELNGVTSEPAHIYDKSVSWFSKMSEIKRHWKVMFKVSMMNKKLGVEFASLSEVRKFVAQNLH